MDDSILRNRTVWEVDAGRWEDSGRSSWTRDEPRWGIWGIPESELGLLPDLAGADAVELGCGTAYVSAWLARRGEFGLRFPLVLAAGEQVPLRSSSFDLVISEYGAAIWADPYRWIPEAARLLRAGGDLVFLGNSSLLMTCVPDDETLPAGRALLRPQFGMHRLEWPDTDGVEFQLSHGDMLRLLRAKGFEVLDLIELRPGADATTRLSKVTLDWARQWPSEEAWVARRR